MYAVHGWYAAADAGRLSILGSSINPLMIFILGLILLASGLCLILFLKKWNTRIFKLVGIGFLTLSFVGGILLVEVAGRRFEGQPNNIIWQAREIMHGRISDSFGSNRGWVWRNAAAVLPERPILGSGPDTFFLALGMERQYDAFETTGTVFDKAHNTYLQIAVCMGVPALIAFLVFLGSLFFAAVKKAFTRPVMLAFGGGVLCFVIQSFFQIDTPIDRPLLYIALGVLAGEIWRERIGVADVSDSEALI
jgi:putative inorganic carbon (HCO3(-)) transporter